MEILNDKEILIDEIGLSTRAYNCLARHLWSKGLVQKLSEATIQLFADYTYDDLLAIRSMGKKTVREIVYKFHLHGLDIKGANIEKIARWYDGTSQRVFLNKNVRAKETEDLNLTINALLKKYGKNYVLDLLLDIIKKISK